MQEHKTLSEAPIILATGVTRNDEAAFEWYKKAAHSGLADGMMNVGISYYNGDGVSRDQVQAYAWFALANDTGSKEAAPAMDQVAKEYPLLLAEAQRHVAEFYEGQSQVVPVDQDRAFAWYNKAAEAGDADSQFNVCERLFLGMGVGKDQAGALHWCERASSEGIKSATLALAQMYDKGIGAQQDYKKALRYYESIVYEIPVVSYRLGVMYKDGQGVKQDYADAYRWFLIAEIFGVKESRPEADAIKPKLPTEKESEARIGAAGWVSRWRMNQSKQTPASAPVVFVQ